MTTSKAKILIIEDHPQVRLMYRSLFEREGFEVFEAVDGESGLEQARVEKPGLILLDLHLPGPHGFEVLQKIRHDSSTRAIPILILSVSDDAKVVQKALELGADDYAAKGLSKPREIVSKIHTLLAKHDVMQRGPAYHLFIAEQRGDAGKLQHDIGLPDGFICPGCRAGAMSLEVVPDSSRPGHWFVGRFFCQGCGRSY